MCFLRITTTNRARGKLLEIMRMSQGRMRDSNRLTLSHARCCRTIVVGATSIKEKINYAKASPKLPNATRDPAFLPLVHEEASAKSLETS